jgi:hypothetical protein
MGNFPKWCPHHHYTPLFELQQHQQEATTRAHSLFCTLLMMPYSLLFFLVHAGVFSSILLFPLNAPSLNKHTGNPLLLANTLSPFFSWIRTAAPFCSRTQSSSLQPLGLFLLYFSSFLFCLLTASFSFTVHLSPLITPLLHHTFVTCRPRGTVLTLYSVPPLLHFCHPAAMHVLFLLFFFLLPLIVSPLYRYTGPLSRWQMQGGPFFLGTVPLHSRTHRATLDPPGMFFYLFPFFLFTDCSLFSHMSHSYLPLCHTSCCPCCIGSSPCVAPLLCIAPLLCTVPLRYMLLLALCIIMCALVASLLCDVSCCLLFMHCPALVVSHFACCLVAPPFA